MSQPIKASRWLDHLLNGDNSIEYLKMGGSIIRFAVASDDDAHSALISSLQETKKEHTMAMFTVPSHACDIHRPDKVLHELASNWNTTSYANAVIKKIWKELHYDASTSILLTDACRDTAQDPGPLFHKFSRRLRTMMGRDNSGSATSRDLIRFNRDFANGMVASITSLIEGDDTDIRKFESWLRGELLTAADRRSIGIMWAVKRDNATSILRSMLAFSALAGWSGSILHLDIRFVTDHLQYANIHSANTFTRPKRIALYQWLREIVDQTQHFSNSLIVVEVGQKFMDQSQFGVGVGMYDALKNRIVDDVQLENDVMANPCAVVVPISGVINV